MLLARRCANRAAAPCLLLSFVAFALAGGIAFGQEGAPPTTPPDGGMLRCQVVIGDKVVKEFFPKKEDTPCESKYKGAWLRCDGAGFEPLDELADNACKVGRLPFAAAETAVINVLDDSELTVEWLALDARGVRVVASRRTRKRAGETVSLLVSPRDDRILRFLRSGYSPVTVASSAILTDQPWNLPPARPGGELVALVERGVVTPRYFRVAGRTVPGSFGIASFAGVTSARQWLERVYDGGAVGEALAFDIQTGETTFGFVKSESVGAVRIVGPEEDCTDSPLFRISRVNRAATAVGGGMVILETAIETRDVLRDSTSGQCIWYVAGLPPGPYAPELRGEHVNWTGAEFQIISQSITELAAERHRVSVSGTVTLNGGPLSHEKLVLWQIGGTGRVSGVTDEQGSFTIQAGEPGQYRITLPRLGSVKTISLRLGANKADWSLSGGALVVKLASLVDERTIIELRRATPETWQMFELPHGNSEHRFEAVAPGEYTVSARSARAASRLAEVTVTSGSESTVSLAMEANGGTLVLRDSNGMPVSRARFMLVQQPEEHSIGSYEVTGVPTGAPVRIRPPSGYVPVCIRGWGSGVKTLTLASSAPIILDASAIRNLSMDAEIVGVPSAECPIKLADLGVTPIQSSDAGAARFRLEYYPRDGVLELRQSSTRYRLIQTGRGRLLAQPQQ